jgi:hypothetical protein
MAAAQLNFDPETLDPQTVLYDLYTRLYNGMVAANQVDVPDVTTNPPTTETGEIDSAAINTELQNYSTILMKNSAYMFAVSIINAISASGSGGGGGDFGIGYVARTGDSMTGQLSALYGFQAGVGNTLIFDVSRTAGDEPVSSARIYGSLSIDEDASVSGKLTISSEGIHIGNNQVIYVDSEDGKLKINYTDVLFSGNVGVSTLKAGNVYAHDNEIYNVSGQVSNIYYHAGNANKSTVDWETKDLHVYGDLTVDGDYGVGGELVALHGFQLGANNTRWFYSYVEESDPSIAYMKLDEDIHIKTEHGFKFRDRYILRVESGATNIVSFSAPGMVLNLGDSDGQAATNYIALQTAIKNAAGTYNMVSQYGDGNFPNSFQAGCGNAGPTVLQTYYVDGNNCGFVANKRIRFQSTSGPYAVGDNGKFVLGLPYTYVDNSESQHNVELPVQIYLAATTSLFKNQSLDYSASVNFDTVDENAEFFTFRKPVEGVAFSIISDAYKTGLIENALMFADGVFIEGIIGGMHLNGNTTYTGSLSTTSFSSGFAGSGWAIMTDKLYGGYGATFDNLTVRKKMRIYELEVKKMSVTNGSLWVSDACSGDLVTELV